MPSKQGDDHSTKRKRSSMRRKVFKGSEHATKGGLTQGDLVKNKRGRIVSKARSEKAKKKTSPRLEAWRDAVAKAKKALHLEGFQAIRKGTPLYEKAHEYFSATKPTKTKKSTGHR